MNTSGFGSIFEISVTNTQAFGVVQSGGGQDFPGILALSIFQTQADAIVKQIDANAQLVSVQRLATTQSLPLIKIAFQANFQGIEGTGAFYVVSPGATVYLVIGFASGEEWPALESGFDLVAQSIFFDASLITLTTAETGPLVYKDADETVEVTVPQTWQVTDTGDPTFPLAVVNPDFNIIAAVGGAKDGVGDQNIDVAAITAAVEQGADQATLDQIVQQIVAGMDMGKDQFTIDDKLTTAFVQDNQLYVRLAGLVDLQDIKLNVAIWVTFAGTDMIGLVVFGDTEQAMAQEQTLLEVANSIQFLK